MFSSQRLLPHLSVILSLILVADVAYAARLEFISSFGKGQLSGALRDIAIDSSGNVFVADAINGVMVYDSTGTFQYSFGSLASGGGPGEFYQLGSIAINSADKVYTTEFLDTHRVQVFDAAGNFEFQFGTQGNGPGEFFNPGIAISDTDDVYINDFTNNRVQVFDSAGEYKFEFGEFGSEPGQFFGPSSLSFDNDGNVYVWEQNNHRTQVFDAMGNLMFGLDFDGPIEFDASGNIYLAARISPADRESIVQVFDAAGDFQYSFDPQGITGMELDEARNRLYITSTGGHVEVWEAVPEPTGSSLLAIGIASIIYTYRNWRR